MKRIFQVLIQKRRLIIFVSGNMIFMFGQFLFLVLLARLGTPLIVGAYVMATAILNPLFFLSRMGMRAAQATGGSEDFSFRTYRKLRYIMLGLMSVIGLLVFGVIDQNLTVLAISMAVLASKLVEGICDVYYGLFLKHQMKSYIGKAQILRAFAGNAVFLLFASFADTHWAVFALPIGWIIVYFWYILPRCREITVIDSEPPVAAANLIALLVFLIPLGATSFISQLAISLPRAFIAQVEGIETLGQLAPAFQIATFVTMMVITICQAMWPGVAENLRKGRRLEAWSRANLLSLSMLPLAVVSLIITYFFGPMLIYLIFGPGYELSGQLLFIMTLSWSVRAYGSMFESIIIGGREFHKMLWIQLASLAAFTISVPGLWMVYGVPGAVWGVVAGNAIFSATVYAVSRRLVKS